MCKRYNSFIFYILMITLLSDCKKQELKVTDVILCDNFSSEGLCREPLQKEHVYNIIFPLSKNINTWDKFANYLYFTTRQTPGYILKFNRSFTPGEKKILHDTFSSSYEFSNSNGHMEGVEIGEDFIGVFNYLGSMVKIRQKEMKQELMYPYPGMLFPAKTVFKYKSTLVNGEVDMNLNILLKYIQ